MRAADRAIDARRAGAVVAEHQQILRALRLELRAAGRAAEMDASVQTLEVLARSAYNLSRRMVELQTGKAEANPVEAGALSALPAPGEET
jgi:hypothetical protein